MNAIDKEAAFLSFVSCVLKYCSILYIEKLKFLHLNVNRAQLQEMKVRRTLIFRVKNKYRRNYSLLMDFDTND